MSPTVWHTSKGDVEGRLDAEFYLPKHLAMVQRVRKVGATKLAELELNGSYGVLPKSEEYGTGPVPLVRGGDLTGMPLTTVPDDAPRVPAKYLANKRGRLGPEEVLLLVKGATIDAPQSVGIVPASWNTPAVVNGSVYKFRVRAPADPYFVAAFFGTPFGLSQKTRAIANTGINYNDQDSIRAFWVPQPDPDIQRAIGNKLRKAERLRELASNAWSAALDLLAADVGQPLDAAAFDAPAKSALARPGYRCLSLRPPMAQAAVTDEIGAQYFHPRREYARQVAARTGRWETLERLAQPVRETGKGRAFVGLDRIDSHTGVIAPAANDDPAEGVLFDSEDILFSRLRPYLNKVAIWSGTTGVGSPELLIFRPRGNIDPHYLFAAVKSALGLYQVIDVTSGSTHPRVDEEVVAGIRVPRLPEGVEARIGESVRFAMAAWNEAPPLVDAAKAAVEALIDGTLDEAALLAESDAIEQWLAENPSPSKGA